MSRSGREALPNVREWSDGPPACPGVVGKPSRMSWRHSQMSGVVGRPSPMFGCGREVLLDVREYSTCPPKCPGVVGRPFWMSGSGWETLPNV